MTHLYTVTVFWKQPTQAVRLAYKTGGNANAAAEYMRAAMNEPTFGQIDDHYGNSLSFDTTQVAYVLKSEVALENDVNIEVSLAQARAQVRANKLAETDSELVGAARGQQLRHGVMNGAGLPFGRG